MTDAAKALEIANILTKAIATLDALQMNLAEDAERLGGELEGASTDVNDARIELMKRRLHGLKNLVNTESSRIAD